MPDLTAPLRYNFSLCLTSAILVFLGVDSRMDRQRRLRLAQVLKSKDGALASPPSASSAPPSSPNPQPQPAATPTNPTSWVFFENGWASASRARGRVVDSPTSLRAVELPFQNGWASASLEGGEDLSVLCGLDIAQRRGGLILPALGVHARGETCSRCLRSRRDLLWVFTLEERPQCV